MSRENLEKQMRELEEQQQNKFIEKLLTDVEWYAEKTNKKEYEATEHERRMFYRVLTIIRYINTYL